MKLEGGQKVFGLLPPFFDVFREGKCENMMLENEVIAGILFDGNVTCSNGVLGVY